MALKEKIIDKAQKLVQKGYLDKAIAEYRAAVDVDPKDISIRLRIGDLYVKLGKKADAIKEYTEAARANAQRGFYLKAIAVYKQILKLEENLEIHNKLAELYVKQRLIADAVGEYSYIVTWFERRGKTSDVLEVLKKMVEIDPENVGVRLKLAELYQKLSFDKDALSEYCLIFDKLVSAGKLDTAEKVFVQLYNTNPAEERVLSGLAELYRLKRDDAQRLRFLKGLFNYYSDSAMMDQARRVASDILQIKPDDPHALRLLKKEEKKLEEPPAPRAGIIVEAAREEAAPKAGAEAPLISWPEEEIEITIEGFEGGAGEAREAAGPGEAQAPEESAAPEQAPVLESSTPVESAPAEPVKAEAVAQPGTDELEIDIEDLLRGELPTIEEKTIAEEKTAAPEPAGPDEVIVPEAAVEEAAPEPVVETAEAASAPPVAEEAIEEPIEEAGLEEAISVISVELQDSEAKAVKPEPEEAGAPVLEQSPVAQAEAPEPEAPIDEIIEVHERAEVISESVEAAEEALETIIEEVKAPSEPQATEQVPEVIAEPASEPQAVAEEVEEKADEAAPAIETIEAEATAAIIEAEEIKAEPILEEAAPAQQAVEQADKAEAAVMAEAEAEEELQEDLSSAIQELMEKMEPAGPEAPEAAHAQEAAPAAEDYVDLSIELGMEEASKDIAGAWGGKESAETFDEFKTGIGKQLSKEDSETHYNLGIAYMEMELYGEAAKEFKIALKDARLELDCYTRLGLCSMAENNPQEAVLYYSKGLKAASTEEEKKGMMYELALAHEAAGQDEAASELFAGIFAMDPDFREVAAKVSANVLSRPLIPLNDGLIEVELL